MFHTYIFIYKQEHAHLHRLFFQSFESRLQGVMLLYPLFFSSMYIHVSSNLTPFPVAPSPSPLSALSIVGKQFHSCLSFLHFFLLKVDMCIFNFPIFLIQKFVRYIYSHSEQYILEIIPYNFIQVFYVFHSYTVLH